MNEFDLRLQNALAKRKAGQDALQSFQTPQGQMVGGVYIKPSISDSLIQGLRMYSGKKDAESADQEIKDVMQQRTESTNKALAEFLRNSKGTPANAPQDGVGPVMPAQAPNMEAAYGALMQSPDLRQMGLQGVMSLAQDQAKRTQSSQEQQRLVGILQSAQSPQEAIAAGVPVDVAKNYFDKNLGKEKGVVINGQLVNPVTGEPIGRRVTPMPNMSEDLLIPDGKGGLILNQPLVDAKKAIAAAGRSTAPATPFFSPVQTGAGVMAFNARTGRVEPVMGPDGRPIVGAAVDPALQGAIAGSKAVASTEGKLRTEARLDAPKAIQQGEDSIRLVDELLKAPGFKQAVGASRLLQLQRVPGTAAKDFDIRLDQLKGQQFLQAFESLKGGGAITEMEGKKATDAIARMDAAGSEQEFVKAAKEFQDVIRMGVNRAKNAAGSAQPAQPKPRIRFDAQGNIIP